VVHRLEEEEPEINHTLIEEEEDEL